MYRDLISQKTECITDIKFQVFSSTKAVIKDMFKVNLLALEIVIFLKNILHINPCNGLIIDF